MSSFGPFHYVNVGPGGTFRPSGQLATSPAEVDALFANLKLQGSRKLTLYFHGGLVEESGGLATAKAMYEVLAQAGNYPVTFIWETGFLETVRTRLSTITASRLFRKLLFLALRQAAKHLGGAIAGKGPGQDISNEEIERELSKAGRFDPYDEQARGNARTMTVEELDAALPEIEEELEEEIESDSELPEILSTPGEGVEDLQVEVRTEIEGADSARGAGIFLVTTLAKVVYRTVKRFIQERDHGFYPTVVEELLRELYLAHFGEWVWGGMKSKAEEMWRPNDELAGSDLHAGSYFLSKMAEHQAAEPGLLVDIVAHSAGSIATLHMLATAAARHPGLRVRHVVFLAPACTLKLFHEELVRHPDRCQTFHMFTMKDLAESRDRLLDPFYTRSLLYFISGVLETDVDTPLAGMERFLRGDPPFTGVPFDDIRTFLNSAGLDRLILSVTEEGAAQGLRSLATSHHQFDDDPETRSSLVFLLGQF